MNTFDVQLDLDKGVTRQPQVVRIRQADHDGTTIRAAIYDHGEPLALTGAEKRIEFKMRLPDGTHYYATEASIVTASPAVLQVTVNEREAASVPGRTCNAYFSITPSSSSAYSTGSFAVIVEPSAVVDASAAETYDSYIEDAIANANEAAEEARQAAQQTIPDGSVTLPKLAASLVAVIPMTPLTNAEIDAITES